MKEWEKKGKEIKPKKEGSEQLKIKNEKLKIEEEQKAKKEKKGGGIEDGKGLAWMDEWKSKIEKEKGGKKEEEKDILGRKSVQPPWMEKWKKKLEAKKSGQVGKETSRGEKKLIIEEERKEEKKEVELTELLAPEKERKVEVGQVLERTDEKKVEDKEEEKMEEVKGIEENKEEVKEETVKKLHPAWLKELQAKVEARKRGEDVEIIPGKSKIMETPTEIVKVGAAPEVQEKEKGENEENERMKESKEKKEAEEAKVEKSVKKFKKERKKRGKKAGGIKPFFNSLFKSKPKKDMLIVQPIKESPKKFIRPGFCTFLGWFTLMVGVLGVFMAVKSKVWVLYELDHIMLVVTSIFAFIVSFGFFRMKWWLVWVYLLVFILGVVGDLYSVNENPLEYSVGGFVFGLVLQGALLVYVFAKKELFRF